MNILLISQCDARALTESRRILDQFAERRGDRTWQTPITKDGLDTLHRLLRKTARKNTAVACHWIRGLNHSELLWVVGDRQRFNELGAVPTNTTRRNVLRKEAENDWSSAEDIRLLAQLAALLHDLGKASVAFQERLQGKRSEKSRYRHEWVSLRMFQSFVGADGDEAWLRRLADASANDESIWTAPGRYQRDGLDATNPHPFSELPPLAAAVGWLVVTHHRLPVVPVLKTDGLQDRMGRRSRGFEWRWLEAPLTCVSHDWNEIDPGPDKGKSLPYWQTTDPLPVIETAWRDQAARLAKRLLALRMRRDAEGGDWLANPFVMHLARLCLMLADHHYSGLGVDEQGSVVSGRKPFEHPGRHIAANTRKDRTGKVVLNQSLVEHLLGVSHNAGVIAHTLPDFECHLPRLANHRGLRKRNGDARFAWQDRAFDAAVAIRESSREYGAFVVNMASTGCGKTLANARILYGLADPRRGLRATYALGLRTLTLQTGRSYRHDLGLREEELAVHVGGSASRQLFEHYEDQAEQSGSASRQALIEEDSHVLYDGTETDHPLLSRALTDPNIRKLLSAPMLVCTVDHLAPATESLRAGRQIAPMLRLMSADLVLDEVDDYDLDDLPALTRLVHLAGLLGARVVLSSATLPPALVRGMFMAYRAGRCHFLRNRGVNGAIDERAVTINCLWTDEFDVHAKACADDKAFEDQHAQLVEQRVHRLRKLVPSRRGEIFPIAPSERQREQLRIEVARHVRDACLRLHADHADIDPVGSKRVSFGIVRMANIDPLFDVACALYALGAPTGVHVHLCVYHARFPLAQRSAIERMLDATFNRRNEKAVYDLPFIRSALDSRAAGDQLFVVLASPVCEVGRDWDADWAVAEPSSMRSLIQLAGRVQRHRRRPCKVPNVLIFDTNLKFLEQKEGAGPAFSKPGFETNGAKFRLTTHWLHDLMAESEYRVLDAVPRISPRQHAERDPQCRWVDLEQARIEACMLPQFRAATPLRRGTRIRAMGRDEAAVAWQYPQAALTGVLPQQQPFRESFENNVTLAFLPDDDEETLELHRVVGDPVRRGREVYPAADKELHPVAIATTPGIGPWGEIDLMSQLRQDAEVLDLPLGDAAKKLSTVDVPRSDQGWRCHPWLGFTRAR